MKTVIFATKTLGLLNVGFPASCVRFWMVGKRQVKIILAYSVNLCEHNFTSIYMWC